MSIFLEIMKEELDRNLFSQQAFKNEINSLPKGYLSICNIDGKSYIYRKYRNGSKIVSEYIGIPGDDKVKEAEEQRRRLLSYKEAITQLKKDERRLRKAINIYEKVWARDKGCPNCFER